MTVAPIFEPAFPGHLIEDPADNVAAAAERVDFRLAYDATDEPRRMHAWGINGPQIPNAYYGRGLDDTNRQPTAPGDWEDPDHPDRNASEEEHIDRWFVTAVRESIHEALEWFWVDGEIYLDPHGKREDAIHALSERFALDLLALRRTPPPD